MSETLKSVGTRTGKITHLSTDSMSVAWTLCGRSIRKAVYHLSEPNCGKCIDRRDLDIGKATHSMSITAVPTGATWADATGIKGTCSCGATEELPIAGTGIDLVRRSEERRVGKECRSRWPPDYERMRWR